MNRPCGLHYVQWPNESHKSSIPLTNELQSAKCPRFSPDGRSLVFITLRCAVESGAHNATAEVGILDWGMEPIPSSLHTERPPRIVVTAPQCPQDENDFPGLYPEDLPALHANPFIDNDTLVVTSAWGFQRVILCVNIQSGFVSLVSDKLNVGWNLLAVKQSIAIASVSSFTSAPHIMVAETNATNSKWVWNEILASSDVGFPGHFKATLENMTQSVIRLKPTAPPIDLPLEALVIRSKDASGPQPTLLFCHGGPHASFFQHNNLMITFANALGYTIILVNYRGSLGYGEASVCSLLGNVGTNDVMDHIAALDHCIDNGITDPSRVGIIGGSHGGFLTGHLVGQYPERFRCGVLRNPVLNLSHMVHTSDIPDWVYVEAMGTEESKRRFSSCPSANDLEVFFSKSPVAYIDNIKAPLLFLLGKKDQRVPPSDALRFIAALESRSDGPEVRTILFPEDCHPLEKPQTEFESIINIFWWFKKHDVLE